MINENYDLFKKRFKPTIEMVNIHHAIAAD